jgi:hypothetical protein
MRAGVLVLAALILALAALVVVGPVQAGALHFDDRSHHGDAGDVPRFRVDPAWPKPLPSTVDANGVAHRWVTGEIAGSCVDPHDNVVTVNRGWEVGVTYDGVTQGAQSGAIVGQDAAATSIPAPPIVVYDREGNVVRSWGDPSLLQPPNPSYGGAAVMPHGAHGCFVDYEGNVWTAGNGDGVVQKYAMSGALLLQIGQKGVCDGPPNNNVVSGANVFPTCGEAHDLNSSHTLLNEPADVAVDPEVGPISKKRGDVYIADGYGNHRVVVFDRDGNFVTQWGSSCGKNDPACPNGTFGATGGGHPHCVVLANDGLVHVCDRPNSRLQVFTRDGQWVRTMVVAPGPDASAPNAAAILKAGTRACDMDFWPNVDYLASKSPTQQRFIIDVDLGNDNTWILDKGSGTILGALGRCGIMPCPGHAAGEFAFGHTTASDSHGDVYVAETITGRRIQKFVRVRDDDGHDDR